MQYYGNALDASVRCGLRHGFPITPFYCSAVAVLRVAAAATLSTANLCTAEFAHLPGDFRLITVFPELRLLSSIKANREEHGDNQHTLDADA